MKRREEEVEQSVEKHLKLFSAPPVQEIDDAKERTRHRLSMQPVGEVNESSAEYGARRPAWKWRLGFAGAVAAVALAVVFMPRGIDARAVVEAADGGLYQESGRALQAGEKIETGSVVRANSSGAMLKLADGSHIEMRGNSKLSLERADDGVRIRLNDGDVIVSAAKQQGHLYVQTKHINVSVVGTVFLVKAEETGSRVAVIEGEVRVQQGTTEKNLRPGEQVNTNPEMESHSVSEEISWSRTAETQVALLQQAVGQASSRLPDRLEFEVASVRQTQGTVARSGFACQGSDGIIALENAAVPSNVPRGRCVGEIGLGELVALAYGVQRRNVIGVPPQMGQPFQSFQITAQAPDRGDATVAQFRPLLQTLLEKRFQLKFHRERQESQQFVLSVDKRGHKLRPASGPEEPPRMGPPDSGQPGITIRGKTEISKLADFLFALVGFPVLDRTGLTGVFDYTLKLNMVAGQRGDAIGVRGTGGGGGSITVTEFDPPVSIALQEQLGLHLESQKLPVDMLVIDHVERPSEN